MTFDHYGVVFQDFLRGVSGPRTPGMKPSQDPCKVKVVGRRDRLVYSAFCCGFLRIRWGAR